MNARLQTLSVQIDALRRKYGHSSGWPLPISPDRIPEEIQNENRDALAKWNTATDTAYSHSHERLDNVLHIFHEHWHGIRAAAGSLPGKKLAISVNRDLTTAEARLLGNSISIANPFRIVFHGMSNNFELLIRHLARAGLGDILYSVHHGAPSMWFNSTERQLSLKHIELGEKGLLKRVHFMKKDFGIKRHFIFTPLLFNMSPSIKPQQAAKPDERAPDEQIAFAPSWNLLHKNLYPNVIGAACRPEVRKVIVFAQDFDAPKEFKNKITKIKFINRSQAFALYSRSSITLNASIVDCHPMVNLESQAHGTPCLRSPLHLDSLENHAYVKLTEVQDPTSISEIALKAKNILCMSCVELRDMLFDYQSRSDMLSIERYIDFLEA